MKKYLVPFFPAIMAALGLALFLHAPGMASAMIDCSEPADTVSGKLRGMVSDGGGSCVWKGVPYAAAPVGDLRWKAPMPEPKWEGVRDADEFGPMCMQKESLMTGKIEGAMSEDCLYLNVWRPRKSGEFPVMVWVHGGGYYSGSGSNDMYWGDRLAARGDVVVVTINYRLNVFGFLAHPGLRGEDSNNSTGGYGTMDQARAIRWVSENIEAFGGDPDNVTIFGESAGGWSICSLLATPLARGYYHKAIMESGGCQAARTLDEGYAFYRNELGNVDCDYNDLDCLRGLPAEVLLEKATGVEEMGFDFTPHMDGHVLGDTPLGMIGKGDWSKVPVMAGTNLDEFGKMVKLVPKYYYALPSQYRGKLEKGFGVPGPMAAELAELYPLGEFKNRPVEAYGRMFGADATMQCPTLRLVDAAAGQAVPAYFYRFDYKGMKYGKYLGSFHTAEIPFIFDAFDRGMSAALYKDKHLGEAEAVKDTVQGYWVNFAYSGDPNGAGLPEWKEYGASGGLMVLDVDSRFENFSGEERCQFWDDYPMDFLDLANQLVKMVF